MILSFSANHWRSFRGQASLNMMAGRTRANNVRLVRLDRFSARLLPVALLFGKNASGKTSFLDAMLAMRDMVLGHSNHESLERARHCPRQRLDGHTTLSMRMVLDPPAKLANCKRSYQYSFSIAHDGIVNEELMLLMLNSDKLLYRRTRGSLSVPEEWPGEDKDPSKQIKSLHRSTDPSQLLLANSAGSGVDLFDQLQAWFKRLHCYNCSKGSLVGDQQRIAEAMSNMPGDAFLTALSSMLKRLDTGISSLAWRECAYKDYHWEPSLPDEGIQSKLRNLQAGESLWLGEHFALAFRSSSAIKLRVLLVRYDNMRQDGKSPDGGFENEACREPESLRQLLGLLMLLLTQQSDPNGGVSLVDSLGHGMHPLLSQALLRDHLSHCTNGKARHQLIATTHECSLMKRPLMRRDEILLCDCVNQDSKIYPTSDLSQVGNDTDLQRTYLSGELGAIPKCA